MWSTPMTAQPSMFSRGAARSTSAGNGCIGVVMMTSASAK
jgi:hypothetical protein